MTLNLDRSAWQKVKFGDVVRNVNDNVKDPAAAGIKRVLGLEHLDPGELRIRRWGDVSPDSTFTRRVTPGQTLFGKRRAYQRKTAYTEFDAVCSGDILVFESADPSRLLPELLPFIAMTDAFYAMALETSAGSLSPRTRWSDIAKYEFSLPPLDEQRRFADLLWACEAARQTSVAELSAASALRASFIDSRFGVSASAVPLATLVAPNGIRIGPFGAQLHASDYVDEGVPVVMPQDMVDGSISTASIQRVSRAKADELLAHALEAGDVLLPRRGELDRRALVLPEQAGWLCGTGSVRVRPRADIDHGAILLALSASSTVDWLRRNASGTTMPNLNASIVAQIPVSIPCGTELDGALRVAQRLDEGVVKTESQVTALSKLQVRLLDSVMGGRHDLQ